MKLQKKRKPPPRPNQLAKPYTGPPLEVERARDMLAKCEDLGDCKKIRDQAAALTAYARAQGAAVGVINSGVKIQILAKARMGELTASVPRTKPKDSGAMKGVTNPVTPLASILAEAGLTRVEANRNEKIAKAVTSKQIDRYVDDCTKRGETASVEGFQRAVINRAHTESPEHDGDSWGTPSDVIEKARAVMGSIDVDPASNANAQKTVNAGTYYTKRDNGLAFEWRGNVWLNPPYSMPLVDQFADAVISEYKSGRVKQAIVLVNNATDTEWFHKLLAYPVCFPRGRIKFVHPQGGKSSPMQGQAIFYLGRKIDTFVREFSDLGAVLKKA